MNTTLSERVKCSSQVVSHQHHHHTNTNDALATFVRTILAQRPTIVYIHVTRVPRGSPAAKSQTTATIHIGVPRVGEPSKLDVQSFDISRHRVQHQRPLLSLLTHNGIIKVCSPGISALKAAISKDASVFRLFSARQIQAGAGCTVYESHDFACAEMLGWVPDRDDVPSIMYATHQLTIRAIASPVITKRAFEKLWLAYKQRVYPNKAFLEPWEVHRHPELRIPDDYTVLVLTEVDDIEREVRSRLLDDESVTVVGFDTETKPYQFRKGFVPTPDLIQLGTHTVTLLVQMHKCAVLPPAIGEVMRSSHIKKVGVAIHGDAKQLALCAGAPAYEEMNGFVELADVSDEVGIANNGLSALCCHLLGRKLCKEERMTDWSKENLTADQVRYAAIDAYAGVLLYDKATLLKKEKKKVLMMTNT